jgi:hypothetical protein
VLWYWVGDLIDVTNPQIKEEDIRWVSSLSDTGEIIWVDADRYRRREEAISAWVIFVVFGIPLVICGLVLMRSIWYLILLDICIETDCPDALVHLFLSRYIPQEGWFLVPYHDRIINKLKSRNSIEQLYELVLKSNKYQKLSIVNALVEIEDRDNKLIELFSAHGVESIIDKLANRGSIEALTSIYSLNKVDKSSIEKAILHGAGNDAVKLGIALRSNVSEKTMISIIVKLQRINAAKQLIEAYLYQGYKSQTLNPFIVKSMVSSAIHMQSRIFIEKIYTVVKDTHHRRLIIGELNEAKRKGIAIDHTVHLSPLAILLSAQSKASLEHFFKVFESYWSIIFRVHLDYFLSMCNYAQRLFVLLIGYGFLRIGDPQKPSYLFADLDKYLPFVHDAKTLGLESRVSSFGHVWGLALATKKKEFFAIAYLLHREEFNKKLSSCRVTSTIQSELSAIEKKYLALKMKAQSQLEVASLLKQEEYEKSLIVDQALVRNLSSYNVIKLWNRAEVPCYDNNIASVHPQSYGIMLVSNSENDKFCRKQLNGRRTIDMRKISNESRIVEDILGEAARIDHELETQIARMSDPNPIMKAKAVAHKQKQLLISASDMVYTLLSVNPNRTEQQGIYTAVKLSFDSDLSECQQSALDCIYRSNDGRLIDLICKEVISQRPYAIIECLNSKICDSSIRLLCAMIDNSSSSLGRINYVNLKQDELLNRKVQELLLEIAVSIATLSIDTSLHVMEKLLTSIEKTSDLSFYAHVCQEYIRKAQAASTNIAIDKSNNPNSSDITIKR